jgi:hypothetical protein
VKRAKIKDASTPSLGQYKAKEYKFSRISGLTSAIAVRASGTGAYAVVRREKRREKELREAPRTIEHALFNLCGFKNPAVQHTEHSSKLDHLCDGISPIFYVDPRSLEDATANYIAGFNGGPDIGIKELIEDMKLDGSSLHPDIFLCSSSSTLQLPVHRVLLAASGPVLRDVLSEGFSASTLLDGQISIINNNNRLQLQFRDVDILTLFTLQYYLMTGLVLPFSKISTSQLLGNRIRRTRGELLKLAQCLRIEGLEDILKQRRVQIAGPQTILEKFFLTRPFRPSLIPGIDAVVHLSGGQIPCHAAILCFRCPFFYALFQGRSQGRWVEARQNDGDLLPIDLTHISFWAFECVLKWMYTDSVDSFADIIYEDLDDYIDKLIEILSVANELMIEPLSLQCQKLLEPYGMSMPSVENSNL